MPKCARGVHGTCTARARGVPVNRTPYKPTTRISRLGSAASRAGPAPPASIRAASAARTLGPCGGITSSVGVPRWGVYRWTPQAPLLSPEGGIYVDPKQILRKLHGPLRSQLELPR